MYLLYLIEYHWRTHNGCLISSCPLSRSYSVNFFDVQEIPLILIIFLAFDKRKRASNTIMWELKTLKKEKKSQYLN